VVLVDLALSFGFHKSGFIASVIRDSGSVTSGTCMKLITEN